ncbi:hypothetical protein EX30DRAFT_338657 [Ascodesmis nigricans]|uniref:RRM domain-containing protein n=1 Tax=Ascodesmis nigricans TaxID=341454 RepID=A0A4S2N4A6_9PEZI|nr:hypothetical protein EX30DRAFT_338657 [Ascodesmis nigricans]
MPKIATKIAPDTLVLPLTLPPTPALSTSATHYLYLQRHSPSASSSSTSPSPDPTRSLYLINLPIDATTHSLRTLFTQLSNSRIEYTTLPEPTEPPAKLLRPGTNTIATFVDREGCDAALKAVAKIAKSPPSTATLWPGSKTPLGVERYRMLHTVRFPDVEVAKKSVDTFMAAFAAREEEERKAAARRRQVPDDDGFVTVTRGPKAVKVEKLKEEGEKEKGELKGFYRFQIREERKRKQLDLVREFERDRAEVEERKKRRRFVPEV